MLKIIHCADIHAGRPAVRELDAEKASLRRREIEASLSRIVDLTRRERAGLLLIAGDLFEHLYVRPSWVREASALFASIPDTRVFIAPGNHDPVVRGSLYRSIELPGNVTVFDSPKVTGVNVEGVPALVHGFGWTSFQERQQALSGYVTDRPDLVNILLIHGDVSRREDGQSSQYLPILLPDLAKSGMDYAALGHIHVPGEFRAGPTTAAYAGCPEPLDFGDEGERGVFLVTIGEKDASSGMRAAVDTEFIPIAARQVRKAEVDVTGLDTPERVRNAIVNCGDRETRRRDMWTVFLTGMADPELHLDLEVIEREAGQEFFFLKLKPAYRPAYDLKSLGDPRRDTLEARFVREMQALLEGAGKAGDERAAAVAENALYYGLDALRQGKVFLRKGGSI
ncbi:MAG: metallophosphoesterase family protein [Bacillota bacterium]